MRKIFLILILILSCAKDEGKYASSQQHKHEKVELKEKEKGQKKEKQKEKYRCPMHPTYTSDKPENCPICGMKLVPIEEEAEMAETGIKIKITPERQQMFGVKFGEVKRVPMSKEIRTVARFDYNEKKIFIVSLKFPGWIEKLYADFTGKLVKKGETLFEIYSPEVVAAQEEYLSALRTLENNTLPEQVVESLKASKRRLLWWDIPQSFIKAIEESREPKRTVPIKAPSSGFIIEKNVFEGKFIKAGEELFKMADISKIWALCDIYETDIPYVKVGIPVTVKTSYTNRQYDGKVSFIYPYLEKDVRTVKVRVDVNNKNLELKPHMFGEVYIKLPLGSRLAVPQDAILDSGAKKIVFVDRGEGYLEPVQIETGLKSNNYVEVKKGLSEGEKVVTSANFLVDSESQIKEALKSFGVPQEKREETHEHTHH